jgi:hypothetical protein
MLPGMMPILHSPAVITPGQFGPISRDFPPASALDLDHVEHGYAFGDADDERDLGWIASQIASAAPAGGT